MSTSLESKICILGAQGVGKTSLLHRYVKGTFSPPTTSSTIGASFLTKRVLDVDTGTTVRLQLWDTAGQERFRSITKLYYRGASAVVLVYSIIDEQSFVEMGRWLAEMKANSGPDVVIHVVGMFRPGDELTATGLLTSVGTKADLVAQDPTLRKVAFERCIHFVAENLYPEQASTPPATGNGTASGWQSMGGSSKRSSGFWGQDIGWDCCHEISSSSGEGIEEVFRVITRKLVEQNNKSTEAEEAQKTDITAGERNQNGYFDGAGDGRGSFRVGVGDKRRSWLGFPTPTVGIAEEVDRDGGKHLKVKRKGCC